MKRITKRDEFGNADINGVDMTFMLGLKFDDMVLLTEAFNKLADYEDADVNQWIPCSERLPDKDGRYLVTNNDWGSYEVSWNVWLTNSGQWLYNGNPIAWMEFPEAYRGDDNE